MTRLTRVSLAHRTVIALLALLVSGVGIYVTGILKQELIPSMDIPRATVIGVYGGASSEVVERDVSKPLEAAVKAVAGVTRGHLGELVGRLPGQGGVGLRHEGRQGRRRHPYGCRRPQGDPPR